MLLRASPGDALSSARGPRRSGSQSLIELVEDRPDCDVGVIGGGVNGTGLARDLALRGLRVALFEKNDLAFGASGNSSGMIHGGARYLTREPGVTEDAC